MTIEQANQVIRVLLARDPEALPLVILRGAEGHFSFDAPKDCTAVELEAVAAFARAAIE